MKIQGVKLTIENVNRKNGSSNLKRRDFMKKKLVATALAAAVTLSACPFSAAALSPSLRGSLKSVSFFSSFEGGTLDGETANGKALNLGFEQTRSTAAAALGAEISVGPDVNNCG